MTRSGLVAAVSALVVTFGLVGTGAAAPPPTQVPGTLTVGVAMPSEGFQVGIVKGSEVVYAQGFEIDLSRALALRMGLKDTVFVQNRFDRLYSAGPKPFDLAMGQISITPSRKRTVTFSTPYMSVDQGVLATQTLTPVPRTLAALKSLKVCALAKSTGADLARTRIAPTEPVLAIGNVPTLMLDLQTGRCDVVVYDAPALGTLKARAPDRYGPFVGVVKTGEQYGVALPKGSPLLAPVNRALKSLLADGSVDALARQWLTFDPAKARVLG
jgi:polar amino acid transport system substrate-binding protein